jgi:hypothetical protein
MRDFKHYYIFNSKLEILNLNFRTKLFFFHKYGTRLKFLEIVIEKVFNVKN